MKLHVLSDIHVEFELFDAPRTDADVVVLAGDVHVGRKGLKWALKQFPNKPVIYVLGKPRKGSARVDRRQKGHFVPLLWQCCALY